MTWEVHTAREAFPGFTVEWDRLNETLFGGHPFFDSRFVGPLLKHFATGSELLCIERLDGPKGRITGALIVQPQGYGRWVSFRPSQAQITAVLLDDAERLTGLLPVLPGFVWTIELIAIDPRFAPHMGKMNRTSHLSAQAYTIGIDGTLSFDDYWNQRPKKLRDNLRRYFNRLDQEFGGFSLVRHVRPEDMNEAVARFGMIESSGWKGKAGTAIAPDNIQGSFYAEIMKSFAHAGQAAVYELRVGDRLAGSRLMIASAGLSIMLKTTYDEALARIAPGRLQLNRVIEDRLTSHPGQRVEFYTNATRDQREWATFGCTILNVQIFRKTFFSTAFAVLKGLRNALPGAPVPDEPPEGIIIDTCTRLETLRESGLELGDLSREKTIEASPDWFELLQRSVFTGDPGVRYHYIADGKRVTALLPTRHTGRSVRKIEALGNFYTSLYVPLKTDESDSGALRHLLGHAAAHRGSAHVMRFAPMDLSSPAFYELYDHLLAIGWTPFRFFCFGNWYLKVEKDWEDYLKHRSGNLRSRIKRKIRRFTEAGGTLKIISNSAQVDEAIYAFQEVYSASWKIPEPFPEFVPALIRHLASSGSLRMGIAQLQGQSVAAQLWIVKDGTASIYKVAYHEKFAAYSPGTVLTAHMMQHVIDRDRVSEVDFLIGDDDYKKEWMSHRRERWGIVAYNPLTLIGCVLLLREIVARWAKSALVKAGSYVMPATESHHSLKDK